MTGSSGDEWRRCRSLVLFYSVLFHVSLTAGNFASRRGSIVPFIVFVNNYQVYFSKAVSGGLDWAELVKDISASLSLSSPGFIWSQLKRHKENAQFAQTRFLGITVVRSHEAAAAVLSHINCITGLHRQSAALLVCSVAHTLTPWTPS